MTVQMKESQSDAVAVLYARDPFDDESPEDKTAREEEEKYGAKLEEAGVVILSSCSVWGGVRRVSGGWYPCLPHGEIHP